jgi:hypothetical protein
MADEEERPKCSTSSGKQDRDCTTAVTRAPESAAKLLLLVLLLGVAPEPALSQVAETATSLSTSSASRRELRVRKSVSTLTPAERKSFVDAVLALKRAKSPYDSSLSYYDQFVQWHKDRYGCHALDSARGTDSMLMVHGGPMFLP